MPILVFCHNCGAVLYQGKELKTPEEIIQSYNGKCSTCGRKLSYVPINSEVKPFDETSQPGPLERLKEKIRPKKRA